MSEYPNIWTDGSREDFSSIGGVKPNLLLRVRFGERQKSMVMLDWSVPGVMQTVQRAEFWGAIVAMQAYWPCHLGIDNLNVARSIGRLLDHDSLVELCH